MQRGGDALTHQKKQSKAARDAWLANPLRAQINGDATGKYLSKPQALTENQEALVFVPRTL